MSLVQSLLGTVVLSFLLIGCKVKNHPPEIYNVTPGQAAIGQEVIVRGAKFGSEPIVTFGVAGTTVAGSARVIGNQTLAVLVPRMAVGRTDLQVSTDEGASEPVPFTVLQPPPAIFSLQPGNGLAGATVKVLGDFLDRIRGIRFGEIAVRTIRDTTQRELTMIIPTGLPRGPQQLTLQTEGGQTTSDFIIAATPEITTIAPRRNRVGGDLIIQGRHLADGVVRINGQAVDRRLTQVSDTEIRTVIPNAVTSGKVTVTVFDRLTATSTDSLIIVLQPQLNADGLSATEGIRGDKITLNGRNLRDVTEVSVGNTGAAFTVVSDTRLEMAVPDVPQSGTATVSVSSIGGSAASPQPFLIIRQPASLSLNPTRQIRGQTVVVTGQNLHRIQSAQIGTRPATLTARAEGTSVTLTVPAEATTGTITLTNRAGTATSPRSLTVVQRPTVTSYTDKALTGGRVILKGDFLLDARVFFTGTTQAAAFDGRNTDEEIWVKVPTEARTGPLRVANEAGEVTTRDSVSILRTLSTLAFTPASGRAGAEVTITGPSLSAVKEVTFGNGRSTPATFRLSGTSLIVTVPADATTGSICLTGDTGTVCTVGSFEVIR